MFANLLSLLASTQVLPEAGRATACRARPTRPATTQGQPDGSDNPLAALMGWGLPGAADAPCRQAGAPGADGSAGLPGAAGSAERATGTRRDGKLDISGMTPVEPTPLETDAQRRRWPCRRTPCARAPTPACARPRGRRTPPARAGHTWRHASLASTETLAIQQAANLAPVRSTVALNERFGVAPGVPLAATRAA